MIRQSRLQRKVQKHQLLEYTRSLFQIIHMLEDKCAVDFGTTDYILTRAEDMLVSAKEWREEYPLLSDKLARGLKRLRQLHPHPLQWDGLLSWRVDC